MKQIILPAMAFCLVRSIFWFGGIDILARNVDSGTVMFISAAAGLMAYFAVKGGDV